MFFLTANKDQQQNTKVLFSLPRLHPSSFNQPQFGVSNYSSWNVALMHSICKQNNYVLPTVYQGSYNPIDRSVVSELLLCLKHLNMSFYAYNPISGGVLSGKYKFGVEVPEGSRYDPKTYIGKM